MSDEIRRRIDTAVASAVNMFPKAGRRQLSELVLADDFQGAIAAETVHELAGETGVSLEALMLALVPIARAYAHPPISNYYVGAVVQGGSGDLILGTNLEFPGLALNASVHGEQAAVLHAVQRGETTIRAIAVGGSPCGHCRQFLTEINNPELQVITPRGGVRLLSELLPDAFGPGALGNKRGLMDQIEQDLHLDETEGNDLPSVALQMARRSYAPYSGNRSGAAVRLAGGVVIGAPYLENVAFNPSLSPLQGVLITLRMRKLAWNLIEAAVLVETGASLCSQEPGTKALLAALVDAPLQVLRL